ncbi:FecR family protein [Halarcobacter sp.]|uniref:FecR family protein n=1 Tax=Halarcobacter sp. TaxID=2321133 RepID=UPI003A9464BF
MENLILKYLTDSLTDKEIIELQNWLSIPENQETFKEYIKEHKRLDLAYNTIDIESAFKKVEKRTLSKKKITLKSSYKTALKYAAILLIGFTAFYGYNYATSQNIITAINLKNKILLELNDGSVINLSDLKIKSILNKKGDTVASLIDEALIYNSTKNNSTPSLHKVTVPNSKIFTIILSDKSKVMLNSGSSLKYLNHFSNTNKRNVSLEGEAYFEVTKNKKLPFIVHTKDLNVKVLGTKFNISSYQNDKNSSVFLEEGSVSINKSSEGINPEKSIILKPKQRLIIQKKQLIINEVSTKKYVAWKKRELYFKNDRFEDIVKKMERYYDITIKLESIDLNENRYTGTFTTETIDEILMVFKELSNFNYTNKNNIITISKSTNEKE